MRKLSRILEIKKEKEKVLTSKNIDEIINYIEKLLVYVENKEIKLKRSYYKECIKRIALSDKDKINRFLWDHNFTPRAKKLFLTLFSMIKQYNPDSIDSDMIYALYECCPSEISYLHDIRDIIGKSKVEDILLKEGNSKHICSYASRNDDCDVLPLETAVIESKNLNHIYQFALNVKGANISKLENVAIDSKNAFCILCFALNVKGANIVRLEDAITETKSVCDIYLFARDVKGANVSKLEDAIIETKDANYIYEFACNVKGANVSKLEDAIIEIKDAYYIYLFARDVKGANIARLEDEIIRSRYLKLIYMFACDVEGIDVLKLEDAIVDFNDAYYIFCFALDVKGANIARLEDAIVDSKEISYIYEFACNIKGANITHLEDAIIETKWASHIYRFAERVKGVNVSKLENAIIETKDAYYIYLFACNVKGANIQKLEDAIIETKDASYIKGANINKLCSALFEFKEYRYVLEVLTSAKADKNILEQYIKKFIFVGEITYAKELLDYYIEKYQNSNNEKLTTYKKSDMRINQLIEMNLLDKTDVDDYLVKVSSDKQRSFKDNILGIDNHTKKSLLESKNKNSGVNETDLIYDDWIYDGLTPFPNTKDSRLKLINLSLIYYNVLPSIVKDFKEVRENVELYLDLLKKCDEKKYYYYKNAFEGKISFEQADSYYKYYLDYLLDEKIDLWGDMHHILKLKYSQNKK